MKCIIIEDEFRACKHLESQLIATGEPIQVVQRLDSVEESISWLTSNEAELIFMDIELGDGLCFEIFEHVEIKTPVIFTTSYHNYITKAFDVNSIAYLLKPIELEQLRKALSKYHFLFTSEQLHKVKELNAGFQKRFLVHSGNSLQLVPADQISYFKVENKRYVLATTFDRHQHLIDGTLEDIEKRLDTTRFFRINRQLIININAIQKMQKLDKGRVSIDLLANGKEEAIVSVDRAPAFKKWLEQ